MTNKIGFHLGPGGYAQGIGDHWRQLDAAGQRIVVKSVDGAGPLFEAQQYHNADHVLIWRRSGQGYDVPNYDLPPEAAAAEHWQRHMNALPPELDFSRVWIETINEPDKNRAEWLAEFSYHTALLALDSSKRYLAFGWASGEPEEEHWDSAAMRRYLILAAKHPNQVGVALHEYAFCDDMAADYRYLIGRFTWLQDQCRAWDLPFPTIVITEFGWNAYTVPSVDVAMNDRNLLFAQRVYQNFGNVLGAAIWYLGGGYGDIAQQAQKLIAPVTAMALSEPPAPPPPPPPAPVIPKQVYVVDGIGYLNLRTGAGTSYRDIGDLHPGGGPLDVIAASADGDWYKVAGWAHRNYLRDG